MYRHTSEVRILQTPTKKTNLTTRKFHSTPTLELAPMSKKSQRHKNKRNSDPK